MEYIKLFVFITPCIASIIIFRNIVKGNTNKLLLILPVITMMYFTGLFMNNILTEDSDILRHFNLYTKSKGYNAEVPSNIRDTLEPDPRMMSGLEKDVIGYINKTVDEFKYMIYEITLNIKRK